MLSVTGLSTTYGAGTVLDGVDLAVPEGAVVAVLGSNGAGKSTLLRAISGTLAHHRGAIQAGRIEFDGTRLDGASPAAIARAGVIQSPEGRQVFARMTVEDNLRAGALTTPRQRRTAARERVFELFPRLADRRAQRAGLLSGGEQQMLAIGRALMSEPRLLLLDEPSLGLAPQLIERVAEIVTTIHAQGTPVLLVEQNAAMALRVCTFAVVLEVGRVAMAAPPTQLAESEDIERLYLGGHAESEEQAAREARRAQGRSRTLMGWVR